MKFKDYAHLYMGARCLGMITNRVLEITPSVLEYCDWNPEKIKPILKRCKINVEMTVCNAISFKGQLDKGLDVFGFIDKGLAIDIDTLEYNPYDVTPYMTYQQFLAHQHKILNPKKS